MNRKGILYVLSGFSGAGKGTIMHAFMERYAGFALSVSATTRAPREGEIDGVHYHFVTRERFEEMIAEGDLIEHTEDQGNYYGTPKSFLLAQLESGTDVFLEIEVDGGSQIKKIFPDAVLVFVSTVDANVLAQRLRGRGTNTDEEIRGRLARAAEETAFMDSYDYLLVNDDLDETVTGLHEITESERRRMSRNSDFDTAFRQSLENITAG